MWVLVGAVVTASVLGSMHCVGMCGPLAIWASGAAERNSDGTATRAGLLTPTFLYHFGRMITYALAGLLAGIIGEIANVGGQVLGVQLAAARIVGIAMILIGAYKLTATLWARRRATSATIAPQPLRPSLITRALVRLRPLVFSLPIKSRALVTGLLTAFLPCGWLYLFALVAAGTGSWVFGPVVMVAFWLGTVPALIGVVTGTRLLAGKFRHAIPTAAAVLMVVAGAYTASGRGFANLSSLADIRVNGLQNTNAFEPAADSSIAVNAVSQVDHAATSDTASTTCPCCNKSESLAKSLDELVKTPLPCCEAAKGSKLENAPDPVGASK